VFFNEDGSVILGIVVQNHTSKWMKKLSDKLNVKYGYINFECPPPERREEFIKYCK